MQHGVDDMIVIVAKELDMMDAVNIPLGICAETKLTTKLHDNDIICQGRIPD